MTNSLTGDILAVASDALQLLAAVVALAAAGLAARRRPRTAEDHPHPNKIRQVGSNGTREVHDSHTIDDCPPEIFRHIPKPR